MDIVKLGPDPRLEPAPARTALDYGLAIAKVSTVAFPFAGASVALFDLITAPLRGKRFSDWCEELRLRLNELSHKVGELTPETLATNDAFVSAFAQATQSALKTHQPEKLEALRNAVLNIAIGRTPDEDEQTMFIQYIDSLSTWHLRVLTFLENPVKLARERNARTDYQLVGSLSHVLEEVFPELRARRDFYDQIVRDLKTRGFLNSDESVLHTMMTSAGIFAKRTTEIGDRFLNFIKSPDLG